MQIPGTTSSNTTCLACHDGRSGSNQTEFRQGAHAGISCQSCHGNGLAHIRNGGRGGALIGNPGNLPFTQQHLICAECHQTQVDGFLKTAHFELQAVTCNDCHNVHDRIGLTVDSAKPDRLDNPGFAELCSTCHQTQVNQHLLSGHVELDVATCGSCHNQHRETMFTASPVNNNLCIQCHGSFFLGFDTVAKIDEHTGGFHPVDPAESGSSRCTKCHLPPNEQVVPGENVSHDHTMATIPPQETIDMIQMGLVPSPNTCSGVTGCHDPNVPGSGAPRDLTDVDELMSLQQLFEAIGNVQRGVR